MSSRWLQGISAALIIAGALTVGRSIHGEEAAPKTEWKVVVITTGSGGKKAEKELGDGLAAATADGWELVTASATLDSSVHRHFLYLRRGK